MIETLKEYRIFFHTPITKDYIDIPAHNIEQLMNRFKNTVHCKYIIDKVVEITDNKFEEIEV